MTRLAARLLEVQGSPFDLATFHPVDPFDFQLNLALRVGPADSEGGDFFYISLCTPRWLERHVAANGAQWGATLLIVGRWDRIAIEDFLRRWSAGVTGETWTEIASTLGRSAKWEFQSNTSRGPK